MKLSVIEKHLQQARKIRALLSVPDTVPANRIRRPVGMSIPAFKKRMRILKEHENKVEKMIAEIIT